ncbi:MAG: hypothetical protein SPL21_10605 [Fibrobacter sp.]|nr:hypothetical protein [Fibrobacter sp.]
MKKILLVLLFLLPFISACQFLLDEFLIEDLGNDDYMCFNNFDCTAFVPEGDSVWLELYSRDTLLEIDSVEVPTYVASLPNVGKKHEFRNQFTLRIHIFCNKKWQEAVDYEFENRKDKYTNIDFDYFDIWHEDSLGIQILSKEFLTECPELAPYRIFKNTNHPPSCFVPEISPNQH